MTLFLAAVSLCLSLFGGTVALAVSHGVTIQELSRIKAVLAELNCRFDEEEVQKQGEDYVLNDVFCADGQYDIRLDATFKVIGKRAE